MIQLRDQAFRRAFNEFFQMLLLGTAIWGILYWLASDGNLPLWLVGF